MLVSARKPDEILSKAVLLYASLIMALHNLYACLSGVCLFYRVCPSKITIANASLEHVLCKVYRSEW